jgi:hypothetical protein
MRISSNYIIVRTGVLTGLVVFILISLNLSQSVFGYSRSFRTPDNLWMWVCYYDDKTSGMMYCDLYQLASPTSLNPAVTGLLQVPTSPQTSNATGVLGLNAFELASPIKNMLPLNGSQTANSSETVNFLTRPQYIDRFAPLNVTMP